MLQITLRVPYIVGTMISEQWNKELIPIRSLSDCSDKLVSVCLMIENQ